MRRQLFQGKTGATFSSRAISRQNVNDLAQRVVSKECVARKRAGSIIYVNVFNGGAIGLHSPENIVSPW